MLTTEIIDGFKRAGIRRTYVAGESMFLANEPSSGMYLILQGEAKVLRRTPSGDLIEVATILAGQTIGEISLLLGQPHSATVMAKTDVEAALLTRNRLHELRDDDPMLAMRLFEILAYTLSNHIMSMNRQMDEARRKIHDLESRLKDEESPPFSYF